MNVKIDTKEKFTVITPIETAFAANMTAELNNLLLAYLQKDMPHVVLNMNNVKGIDESIGETLVTIQQKFYENNCSFVICSLQPNVKNLFLNNDWLDTMNTTPTESEAWDIIQMEEIERELLKGD